MNMKINMKIKSIIQIFLIFFLSKFTFSLNNSEINNLNDQDDFNPFNTFLKIDNIAKNMMSKNKHKKK